MKDFKKEFSIERMAKLLGAKRESYYKWLSRGVSKRDKENEFLLKETETIFLFHKKRYGSSRVRQELLKKGIKCSRRRVGRLMKLNGMESIRARKYKVTTNSKHNKIISPNLLNQNFQADTPNRVWVSDITYIRTNEGWLYLTTVMDLFNREIIGHWKSYNLRAEDTVIKAFDEASRKRIPKKGLIFHSDRGSQYVDKVFRKRLKSYKITQSMSGKGNCYDNAVAESFFKTLKSELVNEIGQYKSRKEAKASIFEYIECYYNTKRIHSTLDYCTPKEYLQRYYEGLKKCA